MRPGAKPILHLDSAAGLTATEQRRMLDALQQLNQRHLHQRDKDDALAARIEAYELAYRMQATAPELVDIGQESASTLQMYGVDQKTTNDFGTRC